MLKKLFIIIKKTFKLFIFLVVLFFLLEYLYFTFYPKLVFLDDETIIAYFNKYQKDFDELIKVKEENCGKYFGRQDVSYMKYENQPQSGYYYYESFFSESPEAKAFLKKHHNMIIGMNDFTWREDMHHKSKANDKIYGTNSRRPYTREDALAACRSKSYVGFVIRETAYIRLLGWSLKGPYISHKALLYVNNPQARILQEWDLYENDPDSYDDFFDPNKQQYFQLDEYDKLAYFGLSNRATHHSTDHFMAHCDDYGDLQNTFRQVKPKWFIFSDHLDQGVCGADWVSLPFVPFFEGVHFKPYIK